MLIERSITLPQHLLENPLTPSLTGTALHPLQKLGAQMARRLCSQLCQVQVDTDAHIHMQHRD